MSFSKPIDTVCITAVFCLFVLHTDRYQGYYIANGLAFSIGLLLRTSYGMETRHDWFRFCYNVDLLPSLIYAIICTDR